MHTFLLVVVTSGLVLLQTTQGLPANFKPDADFFEEAMADGFIVSNTKGPTRAEKPQNNNNAIATHESINPKANLSLFQKDSLPKITIARTPEASTELFIKNNNELPKTKSAAVSIPVSPSQTITSFSEENAEGSGNLPEWVIKIRSQRIHNPLEAVGEADISSDGSGMFSETHSEKQDKDFPFTPTVHSSGNHNISTLVHHSSGENGKPGMGPEDPTSDLLATTVTNIVKEKVITVQENNLAAEAKPMDKKSPDPTEKAYVQPKLRRIKEPVHDPEPTSELIKESTPGWLLTLALCLTLGAVICIFVGVATKDMWYGPSRQCLNINSTESKKHEEYDKAATLPLSEKEKVILMSSQGKARKETDCTFSIEEEAPEKEYLM